METMKRRNYGRDAGLTIRMIVTTALLGLLYVVFAVVLFSILNVGLIPMLVIDDHGHAAAREVKGNLVDLAVRIVDRQFLLELGVF